MNERKIDAKWCREWGGRYGDQRLAELFDRPMTVPEVMTRRDGPWRSVKAADRLWVFFRAASRAAQAVVANRAADRQVRAYCLHSGVDAVERWAARWLSDEDRSAAAAWRATCVARAGATVEAAEWAAEAAAWAAEGASARTAETLAAMATAAWVARMAAWAGDARGSAENEAQIADAIQVLAADEAAKENNHG